MNSPIDKTLEAPPDGMTPNILVVDDIAGVLKMVSILLKNNGYIPHIAQSAFEGLQILSERNIDVVVTDITMPECDGITFLKDIRKKTQDIPVVLMTGYAHLNLAIEAIKNGAFEMITKPFDHDYFIKVVQKAVGYNRLCKIERNYLAMLEETVEERTTHLKTAMRELENLHNQLKDVENERNNFVSTITHELRTPMNGIVGSLGLLSETTLTSEQNELISLAELSAENMLKLVDELLSFTESFRRQGSANKACFNLRMVIGIIFEKFYSRFSAKGITLSFSIDKLIPESIIGDLDNLENLLDILLDNALKYTDSGEVSLNVQVESEQDGFLVLHFQIVDSGIGIPADKLESIFEPFVQVDGSFTRTHGGLGIGLSQARQIVRLLSGNIWAESLENSGSTFHVILHFSSTGKENIKSFELI